MVVCVPLQLQKYDVLVFNPPGQYSAHAFRSSLLVRSIDFPHPFAASTNTPAAAINPPAAIERMAGVVERRSVDSAAIHESNSAWPPMPTTAATTNIKPSTTESE